MNQAPLASHPLPPASRCIGVAPARLKAASLVEVLVSLSLASITFVIAAIVWLQISGLNAPYRQTDQRMIARNLIDQAIAQQITQDQDYLIQGVHYLRTIEPLNPETNLYQITITAYIEGKDPFYHRAKIVRYHED
jgi:hypothetical protein